MKLLFDQNLAPKLASALADLFPTFNWKGWNAPATIKFGNTPG
jgi:predicted nuclease of predicted toxin-antitoxin system